MAVIKKLLSVMTAAVCCVGTSACSGSDKGSMSTGLEVSYELPSDGGLGELIIPDPDSDEAELGSYRLSSSGVKLYFEDSEFPKEAVFALEKYFTSFADGDFETYAETIYPSYKTNYDSYLNENYGYGLQESFELQCENLRDNMDGEFHITRLKAEVPELKEDETRDEVIEDFFSDLNTYFGKDYYGEVKNETGNNFEYMTFFVVAANNSTGEEMMLISAFEIIFAVVDGKYYAFG